MATATANDWDAQVREFELYDEGLYVAQIVDVSKTEPGQYGTQGMWKLEFPDIEREDNQPTYLNFYTPTDITAKNKFGALLMACRKPLPEPGVTLRPRSLIGEWIQARIVHYMRKTDGQLGCKVSEVMQLTPKQRKTLQGQMAIAADPDPDQPALPNTSEAQQQVTAEEDAKLSATGELRPILTVLVGALEEKGQKLGKENAGPGLTALAKAAKAQGVKLPNVGFDLVSMANIHLAKTEALALIEQLGAVVDDDVDPFESE